MEIILAKSIVNVTILHGINAVEVEGPNTPNNNAGTYNTLINKQDQQSHYDHVIFNHPHLGTVRTNEFCVPPPPQIMLSPLANDQCTSKKGGGCSSKEKEVEERENRKTYYSLRRHQSGRSFAK